MSSLQTVPVTLAEIARIAGVGRAAVSNWRRRHDTFPDRIGGTDISPQFSLAEAEQWLRANGKLNDAGSRELLWPRFDALGSRDESGLAIAEAGRRMLGGRARATDPPLSAQARQLVGEAARLGRREGPKETFDFLLQRWLDAHVRQISTTPPPLAALMAEIALRQVRRAGPGRSGGRLTILDPACGTGHLLVAAAEACRTGPLELAGCERDPALAALAATRLAFGVAETDAAVGVRAGDSMLADPYDGLAADAVLCNPPFNERDWGYEELAADRRWTYGLPPRTESELAWVQHALARLRPGGSAVVLLPPAVASRKAGRRIRAALVRTGLLRAVIALPTGCAPPHSVSLHLWVLRAGAASGGATDVLLVDAAQYARTGAREPGPDWGALADLVLSALADVRPGDELPDGSARVAVIDLLDDEVDLTPGRYVSPAPRSTGSEPTASWQDFIALLGELGEHSKVLAALDVVGVDHRRTTTTVGDLIKAGALTMRGGQQPADGAVRQDAPAPGGVPLLTVPDLLTDGAPGGWLQADDTTVVAQPGDVVVAGAARAFTAWVHQGPPLALGPQLYALRVAPDRLDAHFLAGCLRAPSNGRQAGTHASSSSRVDVRRLQVLQLPLVDQLRYSDAFRTVKDLEGLVSQLGSLGTGLARDLSDRLVAGGLPSDR